MKAYYNEFDPATAAWLRELIKEGLIANGDVDERSIKDVEADDLTGYAQCHFFAGIGGWSYALRLAGWPDDRPVWTGSCPCQPFSTAGRRKGQSDDRHLWPDFYRLIRGQRPVTVFGEQVAAAVGFGWVDEVFENLEAEGYSCGATILGAHSVGIMQIRQRLYWGGKLNTYTHSQRLEGIGTNPDWSWNYEQFEGLVQDTLRASLPSGKCGGLSDGIPARVVRLRGYGNAIVPQTAATFIKAFMEIDA